MKLLDPQPEKSNPMWKGHTDGAIYWCTDSDSRFQRPIWVAPARPAIDPAVLARQAVREMQLKAITIGIVPENVRGRIGIIGMPTWLWAAEPGATTVGPVTRTATAGAVTVTATATVDKIVWNMGDGTTVTCTGPGTPYEDGFGKATSPTCGHTYTRQGQYTVTATSYWTVNWVGAGQTGMIPLQFTQTTRITMGEAQVIVQ